MSDVTLDTTPETPAAAPGEQPSTVVLARHVLILGGLTMLGPLSVDMYLPALPAVSEQLGASMSLTQLTLTACILGLAAGQLLIGPLSDARGRRPLLLPALAVFAIVSLLCGAAPSIEALIALRAMQGLAGAAGIVLALAIARDLYGGASLTRAVALLMSVNFLAPILAPLLGGQLLRFASWRGIYVAIALLGAALLLASATGLRESLPPEHRQRGGLGANVRVYRGLLADARFAGFALVAGLAFAGAIVYISASPFLLEHLYGLTPQGISLVFGINALGLAGVSQLSARLVARMTPGRLLLLGAVAMALAALGLLVSVLAGAGLAGILPALFALTASLGLIAPNATALALARVSPTVAGSAAALLGVMQLTIGAVVAPLVGAAGATSALPMAAAITAFGLATLAVALVFTRQAPEARAQWPAK